MICAISFEEDANNWYFNQKPNNQQNKTKTKEMTFATRGPLTEGREELTINNKILYSITKNLISFVLMMTKDRNEFFTILPPPDPHSLFQVIKK